jgi:glycerol-3-phosphate dehydrogenase
MRTECATSLCDLLEHRVRMAIFAVGQGIPELSAIARLAAETAGWDEERTRAESRAYRSAVLRGYQIAPPRAASASPVPPAARASAA